MFKDLTMAKKLSNLNSKKIKMSDAQKIALWCGAFILIAMIVVLIDDLLFYDTDGLFFRKNLTNAEKISC